MDPVEQIWTRLPAFLAVAETEHLPTASRRMHVTASALSRSIRLLEDALEQPLFHRSGRSLHLNASGERLRDALRSVWSELGRTVAELGPEPISGPVRIGSLGVLTDHFVVPVVLDLCTDHPALEPRLVLARTSEANDLLARGHLDVAFYYEALADHRVTIAQLGTTGASVYCGRGHPLFGVKADLDAVLEHPFSVAQIGDTGVAMDGWPVDVPRKVGMAITMLSSNVEVALSGRFLVVLPEVAARPAVEAERLWELPVLALPPIRIYAAWRAGRAPRPSAALVRDALAARLAV